METLSEKPLCFEIEKKEMFEYERMDVFFFHPRFIELDALLERSKYPLKKLSDMAIMIKDGPHHTPEFVNDGVIFLQKGDVTEGEINLERPKRITLEFHEQNPHTQAHPGDILIRKIGVGPREAAVVPEGSPPLHIFVTLALIRLKDEYNPYYVEIFLNSSLGRAQTKRRNKGIGSPCLHLEDIRKIRVPIPPKPIQEKIVRIIVEARARKKQNLENVEKIRDELNNFFLKELGLSYPEEKEENVFITELDERLDPYYYHPKFRRITDSLKRGKFELKKLKEVVEFSSKQIDPKKEPNRLFKYIQIQNINEVNHKISSYTPVLGKDAPGRAKMLIKEGDILFPILGGSLKSVAIVPKEFDDEVATNGFAILRTGDTNLRYYVFHYLITKFAQVQIERQLTGAIMSSISKSELENLLIPFPPLTTQERIAKKIQEVNITIEKLQEDADDIIEKAKEKVEKIIIGR
jgi:restriction endonuclease S subunit